ncbi:MAG: protein kinase [Armatimonadetes bacterium]|nr:protein kinase [Armatimonadota bacterium]
MDMTFGDFELLQEIGRGGMGVVYRARQRSLNRDVAVKVLPEELARDEQVAARFHAEAQRMAQLSHPGITQVYVVGEEQGRQYFAMQLLPGPSLRERLSAGGIAPDEAAEIATQVADALDYAHSRGVVHRDIKPENIMFNDHGQAVVTDFGIAKALDASRLTATGMALGTPHYMAPEQAKGNPTDGRADIYSLGCVLYEMVCRRPPFEAETPLGAVMKHISEAPLPPQAVASGVPEWLASTILRALAKEPTERFRSAGEMARALRTRETTRVPKAEEPDRRLAGRPIATCYDPAPYVTEVQGRRTLSALPIAVALAILGLGILLIAWAANQRDHSGSVARSGPKTPGGGVAMAKDTESSTGVAVVPNVVGLPSGEARRRLGAAGLELTVGYEESDGIETEKVLRQDPWEGREVPKGTKVGLTLSAGPTRVEIPRDLDGRPVGDVESRLRDLGLQTTRTYSERRDHPPDTVFDCQPGFGSRARKGTTVTLLVAQAPPTPPPGGSAGLLGTWRLASEDGRRNTDSEWTFRSDGTARWREPSSGEERVWNWTVDGGVLRLVYDPSKSTEFRLWFEGDVMHWERLGSAKHYTFTRR